MAVRGPSALHPTGPADSPLCVHIIDELPPDGAERLIADLMAHRSGRFRYAVLCIVAGGELADEISSTGVPVSVLNRRRGVDLGTVPALYRWLRRHRPQVVHTHLFAADSYGRTAALLAGVPVVVSTRHNIRPWSGYVRRAITRKLAQASSVTVACGDEVGRTMVAEEGLPANKTVVIANGINLRRFAKADGSTLRRELGIGDSTRILGVAGRLHPQKGHLDLVEALAMIRAETSDWVCVIAGSGELEHEIGDAVRRLSLQDCVRLIGQRADIPDVLASLDLFVMPSRWEGLPMALLEAMALGCPIIASAVGGVPSVIQDDQNGLLVPPASPPELAKALRRMLTEPGLRSRLGAAARQTVEMHFNVERTARAYEDLYCSLLDEAG